MSKQKTSENFLTPDQVHTLNERHGWFESGDAQSDVSRAFAHEAIAMHEQIRGAAQQMLVALQIALDALDTCQSGDYSTGHVIHPSFDEDAIAEALGACEAAIAAATWSAS